jgi:transcriptional regulator with XRE-family HTH domain
MCGLFCPHCGPRWGQFRPRQGRPLATGRYRYATRVPTLFGEQLRASLKANGLSLRAAARAVDVDESFIAKITRGDRTPPLEDLQKWLDVWKINAETQQTIMIEAALAHAPDILRDYISNLQIELDKLKSKHQKNSEKTSK